MEIHRFSPLSGSYDLRKTGTIPLAASSAVSGLCRIAKGTRSPETGLRASAAHEIAYVVAGRIHVETSETTFEAETGHVLIASPAEPHATTALEDTELFFVLLDT